MKTCIIGFHSCDRLFSF